MAVRSYGPDTDFGYICTVTLNSKYDIGIPFGHGQYMWKILSTSDMGLMSYVPDKT